LRFCPVFLDRRHFGGDGVLRHENHAAHPGDLGRIGKSLAVVPSGEGHHAPLALLRRETENGVERATRLECASSLQVLGFETEPRARQTAQCRGVEERGTVDVRRDAGSGGPDVVDRYVRGFQPLVGGSSLSRRRGDALRPGDVLQHSSLPSVRRRGP
jgi:hypothetical protein